MSHSGSKSWTRRLASMGMVICLATGSAGMAKAVVAKRAATPKAPTAEAVQFVTSTAKTSVATEPSAAPELARLTPPAPTKLRRVRGGEVTAGLVRMANQIVREHHADSFGTDIAFELDGKEYVGRIEQHYHPPGGELKPWGYHPGCSLFVREAVQ